ncbi:MAG: choice-of-anchor Q domain-containing protein [Phycisphaerales bacterium]
MFRWLRSKWILPALSGVAITAAMSICGASSAQLGRVFVNDDAPPGGDGTSWASAYNDLATAIQTAPIPSEIWVAEGVYHPDQGTGDRELSFELRNGLALLGGFSGAETRARDRNPIDHPTILSGDIGAPEVSVDNSQHVVIATNTDRSALLDGFIIEHGRSDRFGGGMYILNGSPIIRKCTFRLNTAYAGGGVFNRQGDPYMSTCVFTENEALVRGAGLYNISSNGIYEDCIFFDNSTLEGGSGVYNIGGDSVFRRCSFTTNTTPGGGAGFYNFVGLPRLDDCDFVRNSSAFGAAFVNDSGLPIITNTRFVRNVSTGDGGAIHITNGFLQLVNCLFDANEAARGAVVFDIRGFPEFINCTMANQVANEGGVSLGSDFGELVFRNCVMWDNGANPIAGAALQDIQYSVIEGGYLGEGNINIDPEFADDDLRLSAASPAIDAGMNDALPIFATADLDGRPRQLDDPSTPDTGLGEAPIVDMGAYEFDGGGARLKLTPLSPGVAGRVNQIMVDGATAGTKVYFAFGFEAGRASLPNCPGVIAGIAQPRLMGVAIADPTGHAEISGFVPPQASGMTIHLQSGEPASCRVSNIIRQLMQ